MTTNKRHWVVIAAYYISDDLTHSEALAEAKDLRRRKQRGVAILTNRALSKLWKTPNKTRPSVESN